jgi:membrane protein DedA with SNARE-associated domain
MLILQELVTRYTYAGILTALLLGSLGVPIPEEMPIVAAGILSHEGARAVVAGAADVPARVLSGDVVLYWTGRRWGERIGGAEGSVPPARPQDGRLRCAMEPAGPERTGAPIIVHHGSRHEVPPVPAG